MKYNLNQVVIDVVSGQAVVEIKDIPVDQSFKNGMSGLRREAHPMVMYACIAGALNTAKQEGLSLVQKMERFALVNRVIADRGGDVDLSEAELSLIETVLAESYTTVVLGPIVSYLRGVKNGTDSGPVAK